ncbi:MAG: hypothetical protein RL885_21390 [Planctomycetota bacterium]
MTRRSRCLILLSLLGLFALPSCRILRDEFFFAKPTQTVEPSEAPVTTAAGADRRS